MSSISQVSQQQPVTTTGTSSSSQAAFGPKDAEIALFKTHLDTLWHDVEKAEWYMKPIAFVSYMWNRSEAVEKDKKFGATIEDFNNKLGNLIHAVARRTLTAKEAAEADVAPLQFANEGAQNNSLERLQAAEKAEKEFYDVFKKRCKELEITPDHKNYGSYVLAVKNRIDRVSQDKNLSQEVHVGAGNIRLKVATLKENISERVFNDVVAAGIPSKIEDLTADSYKQAVKLAAKYFPKNSAESIEASLRNSLATKFGKKLEERSKAYLAAGDNAHVKTIQADLLKAHKENQERLDVEVKDLRGDNGFNGKINAAIVARDAAAAALNDARQAFKDKYATTYNLPVADIADAEVENLVKLPQLNVALADVKANFVTAKDKLAAAEKEQKKLEALLKKDAKFVFEERTALNSKIAALRGPNGNDGTIDAAWKAIAPALAEQTNAANAYRVAFDAAYGADVALLKANVPVATLVEETNLSVLAQVKADYLAAVEKHTAANKKFSDLNAGLAKLNVELNAIAGKNDGDILGGELVKEQEAQADAKVAAEAKAQADKIGNFFKELSTSVTEEDKKARFDALHAIIGA